MQEQIKQIILESVKELNEQLDDDKKLSISDNMPIFGKEGRLDSLDFVNLMVIIEDNIFQAFDKSITIVNEKAFSLKYNPFANVERLALFIQNLLAGEVI